MIPFNGVDDLPFLTHLRPAVLVKGPDYAGREAAIPRPPDCEVRIAPPGSFAAHTSDLVRAA